MNLIEFLPLFLTDSASTKYSLFLFRSMIYHIRHCHHYAFADTLPFKTLMNHTAKCPIYPFNNHITQNSLTSIYFTKLCSEKSLGLARFEGYLVAVRASSLLVQMRRRTHFCVFDMPGGPRWFSVTKIFSSL